MTAERLDSFVPVETVPLPRPLHRFGTAFPLGLAEAYVTAYTQERAAVLDPLAHPYSAADAAQRKDRVGLARSPQAIGAWARGVIAASVAPPAPVASSVTGATLVLVDKPGAAQSSFRLGGIGAARTTSDYFALQVLNTILGGSFGARLNQNLRETRGYTYGANSAFGLRRTAGPFTASAEVVSAKTDSALIEFMKELRAIRDTVPSDELARAKRYLQLGLPRNFETTGGIAGELLPLITYGVPLDFHNSAVQRIEAVTQADVQRVARQYVNPDRLTMVIVGDRTMIEPKLRALNPGQIVVRDARDVLGAPATP